MFPRFRVRIILPALVVGTIIMLFSTQSPQHYHHNWDDFTPSASIANLGEMLQQELQSLRSGPPAKELVVPSNKYKPGKPKGADHTYTKTLVLGKKTEDDTSWLNQEIAKDITQAVYVVDDQNAPFHPPMNKGNEAMVYLSYIIDHYANLSDVTIFMHHHRWTWHNNDLLDNDSAKVIKHLLPHRVIREGYVNLRCQWYPGCPTWLDTSATTINKEKEEEILVKQTWSQIFPGQPLPRALAQTCCSQFALSRERIREIPLAEYTRLRNWLLETYLQDRMSGRLFEYLWQYLWTGNAILCPSQHACYCDLFGFCFEDEAAFQKWFEIRYYIRQDEWELLKLETAESERVEGKTTGEDVSEDRRKKLKDDIDSRWILLVEKREKARVNGLDPRFRARIAEREVDQGDE